MAQLHAARFYQGGRLRQTTTVQHEIHLLDPRPFREPPRKFPEQKRRWVDAQVREMLADGIIESTTSPFSSAVVVTGNKDGDYRFCVDYRRLNDQTEDTPQCLPRIHGILKTTATENHLGISRCTTVGPSRRRRNSSCYTRTLHLTGDEQRNTSVRGWLSPLYIIII